MTVAEKIIQFNQSLEPPKSLPKEVIVMNPYRDMRANESASNFYKKYYNDETKRFILFGINPGRFGGGITGVPFTDPVRLEEDCDIPNDLEKRPELSSRFVYDVVHAYGGPEKFYSRYFISALSPLGFIQDGKNLNYYDIPDWKVLFEKYAVARIREQLDFPIHQEVAYCIGQGENLKFLEYLNDKHSLFEVIRTVPHPRWVMQYRLKRKDEFVKQYLEVFK